MRLASTCIIAVLLSISTAFAGFELKDTPGRHMDIVLDGKIVGRYMYEYDNSSKERLVETYKPYLHIFDAEGKAPITKGPGGSFPHHRAIFIGWNRINHGGRNFDLWHMSGGPIIHRKFTEQKAGADQATLTSLTHWNNAAGQTMIEETRTMTFSRPPAGARVLVDCSFTLKAVSGDVDLGGDPEHAGVQYRPANEIVASETVYIFPRESAQPTKDVDYPWVGQTHTIAGNRYTVIMMNHPSNPQQTRFSAYRDYGRFGAFFVHKIPDGQSLAIQYRFLVADGELPPVEMIQQNHDQFAGAPTPSPAPKLTINRQARKPAPAPAPAR
jgi:hypothetical protein